MISLHPPRCVIGCHRIHHGLIGVIAGLALVIHDIKDIRSWLADLRRFTP